MARCSRASTAPRPASASTSSPSIPTLSSTPADPSGAWIQSTALHLITLCLVVERGADPADGPELHQRLAKRPGFRWLDPPRAIGRLTVADVHRARSAAEHERLVYRWGHDVWAAWEPHHATVQRWIKRYLAKG